MALEIIRAEEEIECLKGQVAAYRQVVVLLLEIARSGNPEELLNDRDWLAERTALRFPGARPRFHRCFNSAIREFYETHL